MALRSSTIVRMPRTLSRLVLCNCTCTCTYNSETTVVLVKIADFVSTKSGLPPHLVCGNKSMLRIWTVQASWEAGWGSSTRETAGIAGGTGVAGRRLAEDSRELHIEYSIAVCLKYVNFHVVDAVDDMYYFGGLFISLIELFFSRGNPPGRRTGYRTIVENLSSRTSWQDLKDFMRKVTNTNLCLNSFLNVMNLTLRDSHDPLCVIILNIIIPNLYSPLECVNENCDYHWPLYCRLVRSPTPTPTNPEWERAL